MPKSGVPLRCPGVFAHFGRIEDSTVPRCAPVCPKRAQGVPRLERAHPCPCAPPPVGGGHGARSHVVGRAIQGESGFL